MVKTCRQCGHEFPLAYFYILRWVILKRSGQLRAYRSAYCDECRLSYNAGWNKITSKRRTIWTKYNAARVVG